MNASFSEANELLQRARYNVDNVVTAKDVVRPPSAKPRHRVYTTSFNENDDAMKKENGRPATVHVSNVHQHLRRAHKVQINRNDLDFNLFFYHPNHVRCVVERNSARYYSPRVMVIITARYPANLRSMHKF